MDHIQGSALFLPTPSSAAADRVGLTLYRGQADFTFGDPALYVQRMVAACRFSAEAGAGGLDRPSPYIGGFIQLSRIVRQGTPDREPMILLDSQITHRWPDVVGETLDPERGDLPSWAAPAQPSPADPTGE